jgi:uncharacterized membrane protein YfcA
VITVPLLALILSAQDAVTIGLILGLVATGFPAILALRQQEVHLRILGFLLVGSLPGLIIGTAAFRLLSAHGLRITIGVLTACLPLIFTLTRFSRPRKVRVGEALGVGLVGGSLAATTGTGGPPVVVYLLTTVQEAAKLRGTILGHVTLVTALALAAHGIQGQISSTQLAQSLRLAPVTIIGLFVGSIFFRRISQRAYRISIRLLIIVVSVAGLILAAR